MSYVQGMNASRSVRLALDVSRYRTRTEHNTAGDQQEQRQQTYHMSSQLASHEDESTSNPRLS